VGATWGVVGLSLRSRVSIVPDGDCRNCGLQGAESYCICMMHKMYMILARILKIFYPYHSRVLCVCGTTRCGKNSEVLGGSPQLTGSVQSKPFLFGPKFTT